MKNSKKLLITTAIISIAGCVFFYIKLNDSKKTINPSGNSVSKNINLAPASPADKMQSETSKENIEKTNNSNKQSAATTIKNVMPVISYYDASTVRGFISGVFENDGICTITLTQGTSILTERTKGFENSNFTQCSPFDISQKNLNKGVWTITLSYKSITSEGTSNTKDLSL